MARVLESGWHTPINAEHGFYVRVRVDDQELRAGTARQVATRTAEEAGYSRSPFTVGAPVCEDWPRGQWYTQAFWFRRTS